MTKCCPLVPSLALLVGVLAAEETPSQPLPVTPPVPPVVVAPPAAGAPVAATPATDAAPAGGGYAAVVVSATRLDDEPFNQPYAFHRYDDATLERRHGRTLSDKLSYTPGVILQNTAPNQASPFIRGLTGEQTLLMFDGVRYSHAGMRPGANQYSALIPYEAVGAVDVILGSGSTVLGSDALTGAIDYRLAEAGRGTESGVSPWIESRLGSADGYNTAVGLDGRSGDWAWSVEGSYANYGDLEGGKDAGDHLFFDAAGDDTIPNTSYRQSSYGGRLAYLGLKDHRIEFAAGRIDQRDAARPDGYAQNSNVATNFARFFDPQAFTYGHLRHVVANLGFVDRLQSTVWGHWHEEGQFRDRLFTNNTVLRHEEFYDDFWSLGTDVQATSTIAKQHAVTYGTTVYQDTVASRYVRTNNGAPAVAQTNDPGQTTLPDGSRYYGIGLYLQDHWSFADRWALLAGARFDRYAWRFTATDSRPGFDFIDPNAAANAAASQEFEEDTAAVTGNLRLSFQATKECMGFVGLSQGFRAPNLTNLAGRQDRGSSGNVVAGNPALDPEYSYTAEIGAKYRAPVGTASVTLFATYIDDLIQPGFVGAEQTQLNVEHALLTGVEVANDLRLPTGDLLPKGHGLWAYQATSYVSGEADVPQGDGVSVAEENLSKANRLFGEIGVRYETGGHWWAACQVRWSDVYDEVTEGDAGDARHLTFAASGEDAGAMPGYAVFDVMAGWRSLDRRYWVTTEIENVLDHSYRPVGSGNDGAGLNLILSAGARF